MTAAAYARAIERSWAECSGRSSVLSPREWAQISDWYANRIPLDLVREVLASSFVKRRGRHPPRTLAALGPAIEEAWAVILDGRLTPQSNATPPASPTDPALAWRRVLALHDRDTPLGVLLADVVARLDAGQAPEVVEAELERRLGEAAPPNMTARLLCSIDQDLAPFKNRMAPDQREATRRRALVDRLRREIGLPSLARMHTTQ